MASLPIAEAAAHPSPTVEDSRINTQQLEKSPSPPLDQDAPNDDEIQYPEGGLRAWLVVFGSFCAMLTCFGYMNTISTYEAYLSEHQLSHYSKSSTGWIFSIYIFLTFFCGVQIGPVFDARGPRLLVLLGSITIVASIMLMGVCTQFWQFVLTFSILGGAGSSLLATPAIAAIGHYFFAKRANATGIATTGGSIGGIIFPLMLEKLFKQTGWGWATRAQGLVFVVLLIPANLFIRSRLEPIPGGSILPNPRIFRQIPFTLVTVGCYFLEWGLFVPVTYLTSYCRDAAPGTATFQFSYQAIAIYSAASCIGRWGCGVLADRYGSYNVMIVSVFFCMGSSIGLWMPAAYFLEQDSHHSITFGLTVTYCVLMGIASGSNISLSPVCIGALCDTREYGQYFAMCYTLVAFGTLTGVPIAGAIVGANGGAYWGVAIFTAACYSCALACFVTIRIDKVGWKMGVKY